MLLAFSIFSKNTDCRNAVKKLSRDICKQLTIKKLKYHLSFIDDEACDKSFEYFLKRLFSFFFLNALEKLCFVVMLFGISIIIVKKMASPGKATNQLCRVGNINCADFTQFTFLQTVTIS